ncbi:MAG: hypothetical protein JXA30_09490 [Deltaproteobacteria bacterium]|nr:hypothetical protein [Deltaproteobacteria bacterium]
MNATGQIPAIADSDGNPIVLVVGRDPISEQLESELKGRKLDVETVTPGVVVDAVVAAAPDLVLLVGEAARDGGKEIVRQLSDNAAGAIVPIVVLSDVPTKASSKAFRHGVVSTIARDTPVGEIADRIADLVNEIPERPGECRGAIEEATLDELVGLLTSELRSGVLSVKRKADRQKEEGARIVLRAGRPVSEEVGSFVKRVKPLIADSKESSYEFQENSSGRVDSIAPPCALPEQGAKEAAPSLKGLRILVVESERQRADALVKALRDKQALAVAFCGTEVDLQRARSLDPEVVIVDSTDIDGACLQVMETLRRDVRMRWASVLVSSREQVWPNAQREPTVEPLMHKIAQLNKADGQLLKRAQSSTNFDTRLEIIGPSRLLRVLAAAGKTLRVSVKHPRATIDIELDKELILGAKGILRETASRPVSGTTALAAFMALASGRVHVGETTTPELSDIVSPVDLMLSMAAEEASPIRPSISPQPLVARSVVQPEEPPLVMSEDFREQHLPDPQPQPGSLYSVSTMLVNQPPADPVERRAKPKSRSNWWLGKALPVTGSFVRDEAEKSFGRAEDDTQEVLIHQSLKEESDDQSPPEVADMEAPGGLLNNTSGELAAATHLGIPLVWQRWGRFIDRITSRFNQLLFRTRQWASKKSRERTPPEIESCESAERASNPSAVENSGRMLPVDRVSFESRIGDGSLQLDARLRGFILRIYSESVPRFMRTIRARSLGFPGRTKIVAFSLVGLLLCFITAILLSYETNHTRAEQERGPGFTRNKKESPNKHGHPAEIAPIQSAKIDNHHTIDQLKKHVRKGVAKSARDQNSTVESVSRQDEDMSGSIEGDRLAVEDWNQPAPDGETLELQEDELIDPAGMDSRTMNRVRRRQIREADKLVDEGHRYWRQRRLGMAESYYLQALDIYPRYPRALVGMVRVHLKRRASGEALRSAKMLVQRKPKPSLYHLLLGDAYALDGDTASARSEWRIASRRGNTTARSRLKTKGD